MRRSSVIGYLLLSSTAAILVLAVSFIGPLTEGALTSGERSIIALAFEGSCVLGIVLSLGPNRLHSSKRKMRKKDAEPACSQKWVGHHPDCGRFRGHVISINKKRYCAGCLGLALGSLISMIAMASYLLVSPIGVLAGQLFVIVGMLVIVACTAEVAWHLATPGVHVLSNAAMVIGFLLVVIGVSSSSGDVMFSLFTVLICFLWLDTRIQISDWKHERICGVCDQTCRAY